MTELNPPAFMQNRTDHSAEITRSFSSGLILAEGIVNDNDFTVAAQGGNMNITVAGGQAYIKGDDGVSQGYYSVIANTTPVVLTIGAASPTQARKDIVIARVYDAFYTGAQNLWKFEVVPGTAGSGVDPNLPNNAIKLASINVAANATSISGANITSTRTKYIPAGGSITCLSTLRPESPYVGMTITETDTGIMRQWTGTKWRWIGGTMQMCRFPHATQSMASGATTDLVLNAMDTSNSFDPSGIFSRHADTKGIVIARAGVYRLAAAVNFAANDVPYSYSFNGLMTVGRTLAMNGSAVISSFDTIVTAGQVIRPSIYNYGSATSMNAGAVHITMQSEAMV